MGPRVRLLRAVGRRGVSSKSAGEPVVNLLVNVLSLAWIVLGVWWFFRPAGIRRRFEKRYRKYARWILLSVFLAVAGVVFSASRGLGGLTGTVLIVVACIALLKGLLFARGKVSDAILDWWSRQPDSVYRIAAAGLFVLGCLTQWLLRAAGK